MVQYVSVLTESVAFWYDVKRNKNFLVEYILWHFFQCCSEENSRHNRATILINLSVKITFGILKLDGEFVWMREFMSNFINIRSIQTLWWTLLLNRKTSQNRFLYDGSLKLRDGCSNDSRAANVMSWHYSSFTTS